MYYAVKDDITNSIIGHHEDKEVVYQFYKRLIEEDTTSSPSRYKLVRAKKKVIYKISDYYDTYLFPMGSRYLPSKYYSYIISDLPSMIGDYRLTRDILTRIYEMNSSLSDKDKKVIKKASMIMDALLEDELDCITSISHMRAIDQMIEMNQSYRDSMYRDTTCPEDNEWELFE